MQYNKSADGKYEPLEQKNVDTGLGLERVAALLQGKRNVFETELFEPIIVEIERRSDSKSFDDPETVISFRIIADHARAATFILADGIVPSMLTRAMSLED